MTGVGVVAGLAGGAAAAGVALLMPVRPRPDRAPRWPRPTALGWFASAGIAVGSVVLLDGTRFVLAVVVLLALLAITRESGRRRRAAAADRRADLVLALCEDLAGDLRAGRPPAAALAAATTDWPELAPVAAAARLGADVPQALRTLAATPGASQLRVVAAAWQVAHRSGASLAGTLHLAADHLRADRATARVVATEMAAAQATARLLAALPVGVIALGSGLGGDPVGFLLTTPPGLVCLCLGLALQYAGLTWLTAIADSVAGRRHR